MDRTARGAIDAPRIVGDLLPPDERPADEEIRLEAKTFALFLDLRENLCGTRCVLLHLLHGLLRQYTNETLVPFLICIWHSPSARDGSKIPILNAQLSCRPLYCRNRSLSELDLARISRVNIPA